MTGGKLGEMPEWWPYFEAAEELRCHPADVAGMPESRGYRCWLEWALTRRASLADAREELEKKRARNRPPARRR